MGNRYTKSPTRGRASPLVALRLTALELAYLDTYRARDGLSRSEYLRRWGCNATITHRGQARLVPFAELARSG